MKDTSIRERFHQPTTETLTDVSVSQRPVGDAGQRHPGQG